MISRYAFGLAALSLLLIAAGAVVTSTEMSSTAHMGLGITESVLVLALAALSGGRRLAWVAVAAAALGCATSSLPVLHAVASPALFAALIALAVTASPSWQDTAEVVELPGFAALPFLALATPALVLIQISLGAAYRHHAIGVMPHMAGAMIVTLTALIVCTIVLQQLATHRALRTAAILMLCVLLTQVSLGIASFLMQLLDADKTLMFTVATVCHVTVGTLTLGASVVLALQMERNIRKASRTNVVAA